MTTSGEHLEGPTWPLPDDAMYADASEQTKQWLEATQPEALEASLAETIRDAFHALSRLAIYSGSFPEEALKNAIAQLPPERADVFRQQLEFAKRYSETNHATRGSEGHLEESLFDLSMKSERVRNSTQV